jgi:hypothetical protein
MSNDPDNLRKDGLPTHIPSTEVESGGSSVMGAVLSLASLILLAFILRMAVPNEDNAIELGILLIAVGLAQMWLILYFLKSFRK